MIPECEEGRDDPMTGYPSKMSVSTKLDRRVLFINAQRPREPLSLLDAPLGLLAIQSALRRTREDVDTELLDLSTVAEGNRGVEIEKCLRTRPPAIVGISAFSQHMPIALEIAEIVRRWNPNVPILLGGYHATAYPKGIEHYEMFDYYVIGEGIRSGPELIGFLLDGTPALEEIPGICFRSDRGMVHVPPRPLDPDLDVNPPLDWSDLNLVPYRSSHTTFMANNLYVTDLGQAFPYIASEGCPFDCHFCERLTHRSIRNHSPERIVADLARNAETLNTRFFIFVDECINARKQWLQRVLQQMMGELNLLAGCVVRADTLDKETIDLMWDAGIKLLFCFPESGSERIRQAMNKRGDFGRFMANVQYASDKGFLVTASFILGWPGETRKEAEASIALGRDPIFDAVCYSGLYVFGRAEVGQYLGALGIEEDTSEYFHYLSNNLELCLAEYEPSEYAEYVTEGSYLGLEKLAGGGENL